MKKKVILFLSITFAVLVTVVVIRDMLNGNFSTWPAGLGMIFCSALPIFLLFLKKHPFNLPLIISYYLFLFFTLFLGAVLKFYDRFLWWDTMLHFFGGSFSGFIGTAIYKFLLPKRLQRGVSRWMIFLFALSFSVTISVLWESAEFAGAVIGFLQGESNKDTMTDMLAGLTGALIIARYAGLRKKSG
ncbi:membrane-spanning protein [Domibacillus indicus]|uniref:membrane-spanning protein n=1 Tax=Domibacillus indicus TaxID=1437523 RepID=UPI0020421140|nr:membrane-spanning protein [Domibacillus indicus]MCM3791060.1 membrane-spanning protein [Domibacillus indicus]